MTSSPILVVFLLGVFSSPLLIEAGLFEGLSSAVSGLGSVLTPIVNAITKPELDALNKIGLLDKVVEPVELAALCELIPRVLVPNVDCTDPLKGTPLSEELPNCFSDCVCVHGFNDGYCQPSKLKKGGTACICTMDQSRVNQTELMTLRTDLCAKSQLVQNAFNLVCGVDVFNKAFVPGACKADC